MVDVKYSELVCICLIGRFFSSRGILILILCLENIFLFSFDR